MTPVLEIHGLRKTYRSVRKGPRQAVDGLDMLVEPGRVHGFLGPNGSGKTTTLRTLLGLVRANEGRMAIFGRPVPAALPEVAGQLGAIVESPQFFGNFSGRRTLALLATAGGLPHTRVDEVLDRVGLRERAGERVKTYSLGMKQRLAVASALLKPPRPRDHRQDLNGWKSRYLDTPVGRYPDRHPFRSCTDPAGGRAVEHVQVRV